MQTAIIYTTMHGSTEKIVNKMKQYLGEYNTQAINLKKVENIDLDVFDRIVIGGSVHAGMIQKSIRDFCRDHTVELNEKPLALFTCGMNEPEFDQQIKRAFPAILRSHAKVIKPFTGEFLFDKMNFFQRLVVRKISGIRQSVCKIKDEEIRVFVEEFKA
ncbi:MAG: flavodoxin domain-containing protein [Bacteroidota bacterium]